MVVTGATHFGSDGVNSAEELILDSMKHRGCGIRAASYEIAPHSWLPEACVWLRTDGGLCRVWIHSFAHCFDAEKLTFGNKLDADHWALLAAKTIIDRALEELEIDHSSLPKEPVKPVTSFWRLARRPLLALDRFKYFRQH